MSFRDAWMRVGKASKPLTENIANGVVYEPIHLVLVEEPEAHLHIQVQQVFINKAYEVLRRHTDLGEKTDLTTQLIVSTHSSHVAHELEFSCMRYFRRKPATKGAADVPISLVLNLTEVFDGETQTKRFVERYLKITHCDLFFADAAIFVEGPAERILLPHFIKNEFEDLSKCYLTILKIGGSHAHRFRKLVEHLGINTLIITDLDSSEIVKGSGWLSKSPVRGKNQVSRNVTIRSWIPREIKIDTLIDMEEGSKIKRYDDFFSVRVAFQTPNQITLNENTSGEAIANTFEDSLIYQNFNLFKKIRGKGLISKTKQIINNSTSITSG
jgi:predicted ATP-dependent endonuclease of OLD family